MDESQAKENYSSDLSVDILEPAEKLKLKEFGRKKGFCLGDQRLRGKEVDISTYDRFPSLFNVP